jgi:hypothetical protein
MEVRPKAVKWDVDNRLSILVFGENAIAPTGRYLMRGGICFPMMTEADGLQGFAVMCGMNLESKKTYVFEEKSFKVIDHVITNGVLELEGLSTWFPELWRIYFANHFFYRQNYTTAKKYRTRIYRSDMIQPKPAIMQVEWKDDDQAMHTIFEKDLLNELLYAEDGRVHLEMKMFTAGDDSKELPALHALSCALNGMDRYRIDYDIK